MVLLHGGLISRLGECGTGVRGDEIVASAVRLTPIRR